MKRFVGFALAAAFVVGTFVVVAPADSATLRIGAHRSMWGSFEIIADRMGYWKKEGLKYKVGPLQAGQTDAQRHHPK